MVRNQRAKAGCAKCWPDHFHTTWVPEYAREYLVTNGTHYTLNQLNDIADGQIKAEDSIHSAIH
ncbi:MAG: hypothetical protein V9E88_02440 [Ferruginibacter sp.]